MPKIRWANLLHIYQPPHWNKNIIKKVAKESYRPILNILKKQKRVKITLNINGSLTEQLAQLKLNDLLIDLKLLAKRGQIEFTDSAKYHPLLPKIPFSEMVRQIELNNDTNRKYLGKVYQPKGFFSPELCYSKTVARAVTQTKYKWMVLDEIAFNGKLAEVNCKQGYKIKGTPLKVVFRNRKIGDLFLGRPLKEVKQKILHLSSSQSPLILAMDGETLGHHRPSMDRTFGELLKNSRFEPLTYSELIDGFSQFKQINPLPSSWASQEEELKRRIPYELWDHPKNPIHKLQWQLFNLVIKTVLAKKQDPNFKKARELLDENINSDFFWWASAHPWWSVEIIEEGGKRLINVLFPLKTVSPLIIKRAIRIYDTIIKLANYWQKSGKAVKEKKMFLAGYKKEAYLAGKKVS